MCTSASGIFLPSVFLVNLVFPLFLLGQTNSPPQFNQPIASLDVTAPAEPFSEIREAHLINSSTGWVLQGESLLWTDTAGLTFQNITPPITKEQSMEAIQFFDGLNGWVAIDGPETRPNAGNSVTVAATNDGGKSWILTPIAPDDDTFLNSYAGKASLSFASPEHGFALFQMMGSTASSGGFLFATDDAGRTWKKVAVTAYGTIQFLTPHTGWLMGGVGDHHIYRTSDAGLTWKELTVPLPPDIKAEDPTLYSHRGPFYRVFYQDAFFSNLQNGTLQVDYHSGKSPKGEGVHKYGLFSTANGGDSWQWVKSTPVLPYSSPVIVRMLDHSATAPSLSLNGNAISIESTSGAHQDILPLGLPAKGTLTISSADFSDPSHGWLLVVGDFQVGAHPRRSALVSTSDGGLTFEVLLRAYIPLKKQSDLGLIPDVGLNVASKILPSSVFFVNLAFPLFLLGQTLPLHNSISLLLPLM